MSQVIAALNTAWRWAGVRFAEEVAHNMMGHMLVIDSAGAYHYIDIDVGEVIRLGNEAAAQAHLALKETQMVWRAEPLVAAARRRVGPLAMGEVYSITPQAMISGDYAHENLIRIELIRLIHIAGDIARQARALPDGAPVNIRVTH